MTDASMNSPYVTHEELKAESAAVVKALRTEHAKDMDVIRDQLSYLQKTHTVALMAADLRSHGGLTPVKEAIQLYREVEKALEPQITGRIPAA